MQFVTSSSLSKGAIVSLRANGNVTAGFGMQVSSAITSFDNMTAPTVVNMTGRVITIAYLDVNGYGQIAFFDTTTSAPKVCVCSRSVYVCVYVFV
jgi:hypothetical protein